MPSWLIGTRLPLVHTMHTMARVKNSSLTVDQQTEPDVRERGEAAVVKAARMLTANTTDEAAELEHHYAARPDQITIVPPGVDLHTFHPCDQPKSRAQLGVSAGCAGDLVRRAHPAAEGSRRVDQGRGRAGQRDRPSAGPSCS